MSLVVNPYSYFTDTNGNALNGHLYVGEVGKNAENYPIAIFYDNLFTTPAPNPLTISAGYIYNSGTIAQIYASVDYSIVVKKTDGSLVYSSLNETGMTNGAIANVDEMKDFVAPYDNYALNVLGYSEAGDGGGGVFYYDANSTEDDNGGTIIEPTSGSGRWVRVYDFVKLEYFGVVSPDYVLDSNWTWDATIDKSTANLGTIIDPSVGLDEQGTGSGLGCMVRQYSGAVNVKWFGAKGDGVTDDTDAIQNTIDSLPSGGHIHFDTGLYLSKKLTINTNNIIISGDGYSSVIKYANTAKDVLIYITTNASENIVFKDITLSGGTYPSQTNCKYVLYAEALKRGCLLENIQITAGLGLIYVGLSFYLQINNAKIHRSIPDISNWTLSEWQEVYSSSSAPVYFGGGGGGSLFQKIVLERVGSPLHTSTSGHSIVRLNSYIQIDTITFESIGIEYDNYSCTTQNAIYSNAGFIISNGFFERFGATVSAFSNIRYGQATIKCSIINDFYGTATSSVVYNDSQNNFYINECSMKNLSSKYFANCGTSFGGSTIDATDCNCVSGWQETDSSYTGDFDNVTDTFFRTVNLNGLEDNLTTTNHIAVVFPKIKSGLTATSGTDSGGVYIGIIAGKCISEINTLLSTDKIIPAANTTRIKIKLRPTIANYYYRINIGIAGNLYLSSRATPYPDPRGNWLYSFQLDGSGNITNLEQNFRLTRTGSYIDGSAVFTYGGSPSGLSATFLQGDKSWNSTPSAGGYIGYVCTTAGTPGTWKAFGTISA